MDKPDFSHEFNIEKYGVAERIIFDKHDRFVAVVTQTQVTVLKLEGVDKKHMVLDLDYELKAGSYDSIKDIMIDSKDCSNCTYKCYIAAKVSM